MGIPLPISLRAMTRDDVQAGLRLCRLSHWNQVARDWDQFLRLAPGGATVAVDPTGDVVGTVATLRYAGPSTTDALAWVAMVLVDPACRGGGIGTALLEAGLASLRDVATVGLDATPLGQPLYQKLGFTADIALTRMRRPPTAPFGLGHGASVRPAQTSDLDAIATLDAHATGLDRRAMLAWLLEGAPEYAWVSEGPRGIDGVVLGRPGHTASHLGPLHAVSTPAALALVEACVVRHPTRTFLLDVAEARPDWRQGVEALGFVAERPFTRMYRGPWRPSGDATRLCASIGPEFG